MKNFTLSLAYLRSLYAPASVIRPTIKAKDMTDAISRAHKLRALLFQRNGRPTAAFCILTEISINS